MDYTRSLGLNICGCVRLMMNLLIALSVKMSVESVRQLCFLVMETSQGLSPLTFGVRSSFGCPCSVFPLAVLLPHHGSSLLPLLPCCPPAQSILQQLWLTGSLCGTAVPEWNWNYQQQRQQGCCNNCCDLKAHGILQKSPLPCPCISIGQFLCVRCLFTAAYIPLEVPRLGALLGQANCYFLWIPSFYLGTRCEQLISCA